MSIPTETKTRRTIRRDKPCGCGCKGTDPWHRRTFKRIVRDIEVIDGVDFRGNGSVRFVDVVRGTVQMPWGKQEVSGQIIIMPNGEQRGGGWHFGE